MVKVDTYSIVFLALAVFFFLVRSVLRQRTGSERSPVTDTIFYRLSMIAAVLGAVFYVANKAQWYSVRGCHYPCRRTYCRRTYCIGSGSGQRADLSN